MPDLSADRPLLPTEDQDALELLLLEPCAERCQFYRGPNAVGACPGCAAVAILRHLGPRLLPCTAEHREEWGVVWRGIYGGVVLTDEAISSRLQAEIQGRRRVGTYDIASFTVRRREHRMFEDGSTLTGPWVEEDGSADAQGQ